MNLLNKSDEILTALNSRFACDEYNLRNLDWSIKSILSAKSENYLDSRYSCLEFNLFKENAPKHKDQNGLSNDKYSENVKNIAVFFTKSDIEKTYLDLFRIKENLKAINAFIES